MKELYIQGKGKIDCEGILGALLGLGADPEKIQKKLESLFSFPIRIEKTKISRKEYRARIFTEDREKIGLDKVCLLYTSPSPRDLSTSRMPSSA